MNTSSMDRHQIQLEQIHQALKAGTLDAQSIYNIALVEIDKEIGKPSEEVNNEYVNTCMALLEMVGSCKAKRVSSHFDSNLKVICSMIRPTPKWQTNLLKPVAALCLAGIILFAGTIVPGSSIDTMYSGDKEQYIVQGVKPTPDLSAAADTDDASFMQVYSTWAEAIQAYDAVPSVPVWIPDGWQVSHYSVNLLPDYKRFSVSYVDDDRKLTFTEKRYSDVSGLRSELEQNEVGHVVSLANGVEVYITDNITRTSSEWHIQATQYTYMGDISEDELLKSIESIFQEE